MNKTDTLKIAIAGAPETGAFGSEVLEIAKALGREVAQHHAILVAGTTAGFPLWAAMGAQDAGGVVIGFSPATSKKEHTEIYRLPEGHNDMLIYTGFGHVGKDLLMIRSSDALIVGPGKIGTIGEFTIAQQEGKVIGVLEGSWQTDETLHILAKDAGDTSNIIFDTDPRRLIEQVIKKVKNR